MTEVQRPHDPGGVFATDAHRRVLGHVDTHPDSAEKSRDTVERLVYWMGRDRQDLERGIQGVMQANDASPEEIAEEQQRQLGPPLDEGEIGTIIAELTADGYVVEEGGRLVRTEAGLEALQR